MKAPVARWSAILTGTIALGMYFFRTPWAVPRPITLTPPSGWWTWWDQGRYLDSARAWRSWNLDPSQHWSWPGYTLLGVPFVRVMPVRPFQVPDLICLLASAWLFALLA